MLVITRTLNEGIVIGDQITVTVLAVSGKQVRLGIDAPDEMTVWRDELYGLVEYETEQCDEQAAAPVLCE